MKYKLCPNCAEHNLPTLMECIKCESDLTGVYISDDEIQDEKTETTIKEPIEKRICECGADNPAAARKCSECGADISDIPPTAVMEKTALGDTDSSEQTDTIQKTPVTAEVADSETAEKKIFRLVSTDGGYSYELTEQVTIIGRNAIMNEYLSSKDYVSRMHAMLTVTGGQLYITNVSKTNFTYVNNKKISSDVPLLLNDGDEIGLGGIVKNGRRQNAAAYFTVYSVKESKKSV